VDTTSAYWILIVEDEPREVVFLETCLRSGGYRTLTATDGEKALSLLHTFNGEIGLILSDWMMPVLDGMALLKQIKREKRLAKIPFIVLTAKETESELITGLKAGAFHYLHKPCSNELLLTTVELALAAYENERFSHKESSSKISAVIDYAKKTLLTEHHRAELDHIYQTAVLDFFEKGGQCVDYSSMLELLMAVIKKLHFNSAASEEGGLGGSLRCSLLLSGEMHVDRSDRGLQSTLDHLILVQTLQERVVLRKGSYTAIPSRLGKVAVLVRNSPTDDLELRQAVEVVYALLNQFELRLIEFESRLSLSLKNQQIESIIENSTQRLKLIREAYRQVKGIQVQNLKEMKNEILPLLNELPLDKKERISELLDETIARSNQFFKEDLLSDMSFLETVENLSSIYAKAEAENRVNPGQLSDGARLKINKLLSPFDQ